MTTSQHADLLNTLDCMASTPLYVLRRAEIRQAERLIVEQERQLSVAVNALRIAAESFCSLNCPSTWKSGGDIPPGQPHCSKCVDIQAILKA